MALGAAPRIPTLSFPDAVYFRYGFCPTPDDSAPPLTQEEQLLWAKTMINLPRSPDYVPPSIARDLIRAFHEPLSSLSNACFDLDPRNPCFVRSMNKGLFSIKQCGESWCIRSRRPDENFGLSTEDPSSVLHIIRSEMHTLSDALSMFLQNGIPFSIVCDTYKTRRSVPPIPQLTLGHKTLDWQPRHEAEYHAYCSLRDTLLRHPAVARAALRLGGIPWRLAVDANGPSLLSAQNFLSSPECCSYTLTDTDLNLICGVYKVFNGYSGSEPGSDFAEKSWFAKPSSWKTSGLNLGYWSCNAEEWFQTYKERIRAAKDWRLLNQKQWKSAMLMMKKQRKVALVMRMDAKEKLENGLTF